MTILRGGVLLLAAVAIVALAWGWVGIDGKYRRDFVGRSEAEVVPILGPPTWDTRTLGVEPLAGRIRCWHFGSESRLFLTFEGGVVASQSYDSGK